MNSIFIMAVCPVLNTQLLSAQSQRQTMFFHEKLVFFFASFFLCCLIEYADEEVRICIKSY